MCSALKEQNKCDEEKNVVVKASHKDELEWRKEIGDSHLYR